MKAKIDNGVFRGVYGNTVFVSAFCGDELPVNVAARGAVSFEKSLRRQNAFAKSPLRPLRGELASHLKQ
jgi:hypothetical protein